LAALEEMLGQVVGTGKGGLHLGGELGELANHGRHPRSEERSTADTWADQSEADETFEDEDNNSDYPTNDFDSVPMLNLFQDAMDVRRGEVVVDVPGKTTAAQDRHIRFCLEEVGPFLPTADGLTHILEVTEPFWGLWPGSPSGHDQARTLVVDGLRSWRPARVAKSLLWLALCIEQTPRNLQTPSGTWIPAPLRAVVAAYIGCADRLLAEGAGDTESMECFLLQHRLYINVGKPRRAWACLRRATTHAMLLGMHNRPDSHLWTYCWQYDRVLSLILGFPPAMSDSHPGLAKRGGSSVEEEIMHDIAVIAGHIVERNQNHQTANYSVTVEIDEELERLKRRIPLEWWDEPLAGRSVSYCYQRQTTKLFYHSLCKMLHLPYMLQSSPERKYEPSRAAAVEACREIVRCYLGLRSSTAPSLVVCDLLDFFAFSAAVVLVIDLLGRGTDSAPSDWDLVDVTTKQLRRVSQVLDCVVARQASNLLGRLCAWRDPGRPGGGHQEEGFFEAAIPYFGKVRIAHGLRSSTEASSQTPPGRAVAAATPAGSSVPSSSSAATTDFVEFSASSVTWFGQPPSTAVSGSASASSPDRWLLSEAELGVDWTSLAMDLDGDYDWSQLFESGAGSGTGMQ
jgi:hypothetical protein